VDLHRKCGDRQIGSTLADIRTILAPSVEFCRQSQVIIAVMAGFTGALPQRYNTIGTDDAKSKFYYN
jgi:hypothetical protein